MIAREKMPCKSWVSWGWGWQVKTLTPGATTAPSSVSHSTLGMQCKMKQWCAYHPNNFVSWKLERTIEQRSINRIFIWTCHLSGILLICLDSLPWYRARGDCIWFKQKRMKKACIFPNIWVNQLFRFGALYIYIYILSYIIVIYSTVIEHLIILDHGSCQRDPKGPPEFQSSHASSHVV